MGSSQKSVFEAAESYGSKIIPARDANAMSVEQLLDEIQDFENCFVTIDIDGFDISVAPGTGSPFPGGLSYEKVNLLL